MSKEENKAAEKEEEKKDLPPQNEKAEEKKNDENPSPEGEKEDKTGSESEKEDAGDKSEDLLKQIEDLKAENADLKDQVLRRAADFDNYRKRMIQEKADALEYGITNLLKDLLESLDNFDRAIEAAEKATDPKSIADGVKMINRSMISMLENKYNLVSYGAVGDEFNPDIHEAIGSSQDPVAEPLLKAVYLKGYKLKDRIVRHAKVMVSMPDGSVKAENKPEDKKEDSKAE